MNVLCLILGGGRGTRLWPLTKDRAKPAVPIGGKYRLVDICVSNCLNSGMHHIAVLTQYNSVSLNRHIAQTYHFDFFHTGWVQILAAEQKESVSDWYQGTADAVRKHLDDIRSSGAKDIIILAGDHLYRMDYSRLLRFHRASRAAITVAVKPVQKKDTSRFGILKQAPDGRITAFAEKPGDTDQLAGLASGDDPELPFLASMGIYVFQPRILFELLDSQFVDFGRDVIPAAIESYKVHGYRFEDYWEDIGTVRSFYDANLALVQAEPPFTFNDTLWPVYTRPRFLPGCRLYDVKCDRALLTDGCIIEQAEIYNSLIGNRSVIRPQVVIRDTVLMGAGRYENETGRQTTQAPPIGIGEGSRISGAIIDRDVRIGAGVRIEPFPPGTNIDEENWSVRDGIVAISHHTVIAAGTVIAPSV
ncbi:MAG: sugar phosphate nucleotidyltransferase [Chromatiaceae bacterium]